MVQSTEEIYNDLVAEKAEFASLDTLAVPATEAGRSQAQQLVKNLNSGSGAAVWSVIYWTFAYMCRKIQVLWQRTETELNQLAETAQPGTKAWLVAQALNYRDGYPLLLDSNYRAYYSEEAQADQDAAIVKAAAVNDTFGVALLKVAKGTPGSYLPLSTEQMDRFRNYIDELRFAGQSIQPVSRSSDLLRITVSVYFDGLLDQSAILESSKQAVRDYLAFGLGFNGVVAVSEVVARIKAVTGVNDVAITAIEAKQAIGTYGTITRVYTANAGYIKMDETSTFNLISE